MTGGWVATVFVECPRRSVQVVILYMYGVQYRIVTLGIPFMQEGPLLPSYLTESKLIQSWTFVVSTLLYTT